MQIQINGHYSCHYRVQDGNEFEKAQIMLILQKHTS